MADETTETIEEQVVTLTEQVSALSETVTTLTDTVTELTNNIAALTNDFADYKTSVNTRFNTVEDNVSSLVGEENYNLRYSGEEVDTVCDKVLPITQTTADINQVVGGLKSFKQSGDQLNYIYEKVMSMPEPSDLMTIRNAYFKMYLKSTEFDISINYSNSSGGYSSKILKDFIPKNAKNPRIFVSTDWGGIRLWESSVGAKLINNTDIEVKLTHGSTWDEGTRTTKVYVLAIYNL